MRRRAQKWVGPYLKRYLEDPGDAQNKKVKTWTESFTRFRVEIRRVLGPSNENKVATRVI